MTEMTVGCIRSNVAPAPAGIMEVLLEKAKKDRDTALQALLDIASLDTSQLAGSTQCAAVLLAMNALESIHPEP